MNDSGVRTKVNIGQLKKFGLEEIPPDWPLREILLAESEELDVSVFLARLPLYLKLSSFKRSR